MQSQAWLYPGDPSKGPFTQPVYKDLALSHLQPRISNCFHSRDRRPPPPLLKYTHPFLLACDFRPGFKLIDKT